MSGGVSTVEYIVLWRESQQHTLCSVQHPFRYLDQRQKIMLIIYNEEVLILYTVLKKTVGAYKFLADKDLGNERGGVCFSRQYLT